MISYYEARKGITEDERKRYVRSAGHLGYPASVLDKLKAAATELQCDRIMINARLEAIRKEEENDKRHKTAYAGA